MKNQKHSIFFAWLATTLFTIGVVKLTSIGEVIFVISEKRGMGVHSFDLIVFIPIVFCIIFTVRQLKKR